MTKFYLLTETVAGSGKFALQSDIVHADTATAALSALASLAGSARYGVWPYRAMAGAVPIGVAPTGDEAGKVYQALRQSAGTSGDFELDTTTTLTSDTSDAAALAVNLGLSVGYRVALFPAPAAASGTPPASSGGTSSSGGSVSSGGTVSSGSSGGSSSGTVTSGGTATPAD